MRTPSQPPSSPWSLRAPSWAPWRRRSALLGWCCLVGCLALCSLSRGAEPPARGGERVAIVRLAFLGLTSELEARLRGALRAKLQDSGFNLAEERDVDERLQQEPTLTQCVTRSCYAKLALVLGVRRVIEGTLQHPQRSSYTMRLQVRDLKSGRVVGQAVDERCDICSTEELLQMVQRAGERLARSAPPGAESAEGSEHGILQVDSQPLGAEVELDGIVQEDRTPAMFMLNVGVHSLVLRAPGHEQLRRPVEISPDQHLTLNMELVPIAPKRPWLTALSWTSLVGGLGLLAGTGVLYAYHDRPVLDGCVPPASGDFACPLKWDTRAAYISTAVGGGVLLLGAGLFFYFDHAKPQRRSVVSRKR